MTLGIIRVLTTQDDALLQEHGRLIREAYGLESISRCIPDQFSGIYDDASEAIAIPKIVALGREMHEAGCDALLLSCAADPGLTALRAAVPIPVVGAGSATARVAKLLGLPTAVLGIGSAAPQPFRTMLGEDVRYVQPRGVQKTTDLMTAAGREATLEAARELYATGTRVIAFSCTGLSTIGMAQRIGKHLGGVAIDAVSAAGMFAVALLGKSINR